mmetsp:Transcript_22187/g.61459  ORF Transcript_22187/g.61459 Transcript_22187/m.61459 type:complete len:209 (-) Transcript_22187:1073-1699(-)
MRGHRYHQQAVQSQDLPTSPSRPCLPNQSEAYSRVVPTTKRHTHAQRLHLHQACCRRIAPPPLHSVQALPADEGVSAPHMADLCAQAPQPPAGPGMQRSRPGASQQAPLLSNPAPSPPPAARRGATFDQRQQPQRQRTRLALHSVRGQPTLRSRARGRVRGALAPRTTRASARLGPRPKCQPRHPSPESPPTQEGARAPCRGGASNAG